jgi:phenylalanyl-tRNA synthetase beta chain
MKVLHDWLKEYVGDEMPETIDLEKLFTFHAFEIEDIDVKGRHTIIDVKVLPDRSSDCLSHRGIAHELSALMGKSLIKDPLKEYAVLEPRTERLSVQIENVENCRRFSAALVTGVKCGPSPEWLRTRLEALGQRSINNVVDATNYVMLSLGQPLHAYDADKFPHNESGWHLGVRMGYAGEFITTLTGETYPIDKRVQLIVSGTFKKDVELIGIPVQMGIAGIKGGQLAAVDSETKNIIIEAANFDSVVTRRSSQSLRLQTDASKRFENELPPALTAYGLRDCVALVLELAGGVCEGYVDEYPNEKKNIPVRVTHLHLESLLGVSIPKEKVESILAHLGFSFEQSNDGWSIIAPFERTDVTIAEDIIADIGRVFGYEHIASVVPDTVPLIEYNARHYYSEQIREALAAEGFSEVITSSFRKKDEIELANALASDKGCLRSSLRENIKEVLDRNMPNVDLLGLTRMQIFEIGTVFHKQENAEGEKRGIIEHVSLAMGLRQKQTGYSPKDDEQLKIALAKIESLLDISLNAVIKEGILECNLTEVIAQLPQPTAYAPYTPKSDILFKAYSQYPFISRDIALWTPKDTTALSVESLIRTEAGDILTRVTCFDEFHKEEKISYAFRLIFQSPNRTLTDVEIGTVMEQITTQLKQAGYEAR